MNTHQIILSVISIFRDKREWIEPALSALYEITEHTCEYIFIDDGSADGSTGELRSLIEEYGNENTFFYEQNPARGRAVSLNTAIEQARGRLLWFPENIQEIDKDRLSRTIDILIGSGSQVAVAADHSLPESIGSWLTLLQNDRLTPDRNYLFNFEQIPPDQKFLDPHWPNYNATEWALRLSFHTQLLQVAPFAGGHDQELVPDERSKKEFLFALLRSPEPAVSEHSEVLGMLESLNLPFTKEDENQTKTTPLSDSRESDDDKRPGSDVHLESGVPPESDPQPESDVHSESGVPPESDPQPESDVHSESGVPPESDPQPESDVHSESGVPPESDVQPESDVPAENGVYPERREGFSDQPGQEQQPPLTIIIPTSTNRRPLLEECLNSVIRYTSPDRTRIIIVDNGSVDDTPDYLESLLKTNMALTVLTNERNLGFAAAVNQGLSKAGNGTVIVMHNDVQLINPLPARLAHILEKYPDIGLVSPRADHTWNEVQSIGRAAVSSGDNPDAGATDPAASASGSVHSVATDDTSMLTEVNYIDGYCMAFRNDPGLTFSKDYGLAWFEDTDFCYRIMNKGYRIVVADKEEVIHHSGVTTGDLGLTFHSKIYWKNAAHFHRMWQIEPHFPAERTGDDPLHQFALLGNLINPFYPEEHLLDYFHELFTSEQKTRILNTDFPPDMLKSLIRLMMADNQREILRKLEQQLESIPPDLHLYHDLIAFYFDRTIYSRCKIYLDNPEVSELPFELKLYRLKIAIGEKDYEQAALYLKELMEEIPTNPEVLMLAAEIHRRSGNYEQSEKFTALAKSFDPYIKNRI